MIVHVNTDVMSTNLIINMYVKWANQLLFCLFCLGISKVIKNEYTKCKYVDWQYVIFKDENKKKQHVNFVHPKRIPKFTFTMNSQSRIFESQ